MLQSGDHERIAAKIRAETQKRVADKLRNALLIENKAATVMSRKMTRTNEEKERRAWESTALACTLQFHPDDNRGWILKERTDVGQSSSITVKKGTDTLINTCTFNNNLKDHRKNNNRLTSSMLVSPIPVCKTTPLRPHQQHDFDGMFKNKRFI
mmetsp:Transcript_8283/g.18039  ORF Transcript_8283/g.18039 Transcript_8283/m.18039 type:complete len:154 (+) Transcript_8283:921-1382(+)